MAPRGRKLIGGETRHVEVSIGAKNQTFGPVKVVILYRIVARKHVQKPQRYGVVTQNLASQAWRSVRTGLGAFDA